MKGVIGTGIVVAIFSLAFVPYHFVGYNEASMIAAGRPSAAREGSFTAPLWTTMTNAAAEEYVHALPSPDASPYSAMILVKVEHVEPVWGPVLFRLAIIAACTVLLGWMVGSGKRTNAGAAQPNSAP